MTEPDFDVAVVGAGPAGALTAYLLARDGHSVVLIDRGAAPGAKNLSGGVLYSRVLGQVFPDYLTQAPVERRITRNVVQFCTPDSAVGLDAWTGRLADPVNAVTVLRAKLDAWLAEQCEEVGAFAMSGVRVDELLTEPAPGTALGRRVIGVRAGDDELRAHVVVAADGVNSFLARSIGLRQAPATHQLAVGVKAVVELGAERIEDRFGVGADEGAAHAFVGDCTQGVAGGGFCYTNRESVSLGVVLRLDDLVASGRAASDVFEHYLAHPAVQRLVRGGTMVEYGSHLVAEGGLAMLGEIACDGMVVVGDAAGLTINSGLTVRGMDLAIGSGIAAAGAIHDALTSTDTSKAGLEGYRRRLFDGFVGQDLTTYAKAPAFLERPRTYVDYGPLLEEIMLAVFGLDTTPRRPMARVVRDALRASPVRTRDLVADAWAGVRAL
ncbi:MAG: FAD-dependent oxidoreductase [Actinobacteria bacterium]|nr:FAD-dependent oxidoreductase [Actinomycetota bacterium]MCG2801977.1 FAD-dependent oxidoreductase [Cellulomonas sp.]